MSVRKTLLFYSCFSGFDPLRHSAVPRGYTQSTICSRSFCRCQFQFCPPCCASVGFVGQRTAWTHVWGLIWTRAPSLHPDRDHALAEVLYVGQCIHIPLISLFHMSTTHTHCMNVSTVNRNTADNELGSDSSSPQIIWRNKPTFSPGICIFF